jgi:hypothetical protein
MFQPQATPYMPFSSYGVASPIPDYSAFQPSAGLVVGSGGPTTVFRNPIFSPVAPTNFNTNSNNNNTHTYNKMAMAGSDLDAQEALARDFQPALEVRRKCDVLRSVVNADSPAQGPLVGEKRSSHAITEEYAKADPVYIAKTTVSVSAVSSDSGLTWARLYHRNTRTIELSWAMATVDGGVSSTPSYAVRSRSDHPHPHPHHHLAMPQL